MQGCQNLSDRGKAFGMRTRTIDGNDPVVSYQALKAAMDYVRRERRPFLLEATVSRLYGHSSASGANRITDEVDCLQTFEERLEKQGMLSRSEREKIRARWSEELAELSRQVKEEPMPSAESIWDHIFAEPK